MTAAPETWSALTLPGAQQSLLHADANGQRYRVSVWLPASAAPPTGFPALFVLDGNALFASFVEAVRRSSRRPDATGIGPMAIIGIAQDDTALPAHALYAEDARRRDFTFGPAADEPPAPAGSTGGGAAFLGFVLDQLMPLLQARWPLDARRRGLFGHSLAGQFVLQALARQPQAFAQWMAISPSIWWDEAHLREGLLAALPHPSQPRLMMAVGEYEDAVPPWQRDQPGHAHLLQRRSKRQMVASAQALAQQLAPRFASEDFVFRVFPEEDHASILMIAAQRALRFMGR